VAGFSPPDAGFLYSSEADPDGEFDHVDEADAEQDFATFMREIEFAREAAAASTPRSPSGTCGRPSST
jgi:hypothetical protein